MVVQLDGSGGVTSRETGWGNGPGFPGANWSTYFTHTVQCCPVVAQVIQPGDFRTQTQGGWGAACKGANPGCYRDDHFASCFTSGLTVGGGYTATFSSSGAVEGFLPQGGPASALFQNHVDLTSTEAGVLGGQIVALTLSVNFDQCDASFGASPVQLQDLVVCDATSVCNGMPVYGVLAEANVVLGGGTSQFSPSEISGCLASINENFVDGTQVGTYLCLPEPE